MPELLIQRSKWNSFQSTIFEEHPWGAVPSRKEPFQIPGGGETGVAIAPWTALSSPPAARAANPAITKAQYDIR